MLLWRFTRRVKRWIPAPPPARAVLSRPLTVDTLGRRFTSPNAPARTDLLGTITLAVLAGQNRYAHLTALRADSVNPQGLGMGKVCSEDSVGRAFADANPKACAAWRLARCKRPGNRPCGNPGSWTWT